MNQKYHKKRSYLMHSHAWKLESSVHTGTARKNAKVASKSSFFFLSPQYSFVNSYWAISIGAHEQQPDLTTWKRILCRLIYYYTYINIYIMLELISRFLSCSCWQKYFCTVFVMSTYLSFFRSCFLSLCSDFTNWNILLNFFIGNAKIHYYTKYKLKIASVIFCIDKNIVISFCHMDFSIFLNIFICLILLIRRAIVEIEAFFSNN